MIHLQALRFLNNFMNNLLCLVLEEVIHESQTAYIPRRYVHDNLRSLELIKQHCKQEKIKGLLVGVDAEKLLTVLIMNICVIEY